MYDIREPLPNQALALQEGKKLMGEFERREAEKRDAERSKNDLEAYIISTGCILEDGAYDEVATATPDPHHAGNNFPHLK